MKKKFGSTEPTSSWCKVNSEDDEFLPVVSQGDLFLLPILTAVRTAHHPGAGFVFTKHGLHGISDFTYGASKQSSAGKRSFSTFLLFRDQRKAILKYEFTVHENDLR